MVSQAGVYKLDLYENKGVAFTYDSNGNITAIINTGEVLNFETDYNDPQYENKKIPAKNNQVVNDHEIKFHIDSLEQSNFDIIEKLQSTIYGFIPKMELLNGDVYIIDTPFFPDVDKLNSQQSHTFEIELTPRVKTIEELKTFV